MIWKQFKVPHQLSGGYSTGLSLGWQYSNNFCDIFTRNWTFMVDWLSNLQFWKKHCHLVAKFQFFSATTLSWLHLSWLWKFQSWQSRLFHRWNWCGKSRLFYQKGNLLKNNNNPSKYKKRPFAKQERKHTVPCRNNFEAKKCQICKPIANWYIKGVQYTGSPFQYQNGYWDLLHWNSICPTQPIFTNTDTAMLFNHHG